MSTVPFIKIDERATNCNRNWARGAMLCQKLTVHVLAYVAHVAHEVLVPSSDGMGGGDAPTLPATRVVESFVGAE